MKTFCCVLFAVFSAFAISQAFETETFLENCAKDPFFFRTFYIEELKDCLVCHNVSITQDDSKAFKTEALKITHEDCVIFDGGEVGVVNSDFFKQFPNTSRMSFQNVKMDLKPSEMVEQHKKMILLGILSSDIKGNYKTNALHSLTNLKKFVLSECLLEHTTIDKRLLEKSTQLLDVTMSDSGVHPPNNESQPILANVDEDIFQTITNLENVYISIHKMESMPPKLLQGQTKLTFAEIDGRFKEFPNHLPPSIKDLTVSFFNFKKITKENFKNLKNLEKLSMYWSHLEEIDENTFEDLNNLEVLNLNTNQIKNFSSKLLKNNKNIKFVMLKGNPLTGAVDLTDLGLKKNKNEGFFVADGFEV